MNFGRDRVWTTTATCEKDSAKAITYDECPFLKRAAWVKAVFFSRKDNFHSGISLKKGAFMVCYGFR